MPWSPWLRCTHLETDRHVITSYVGSTFSGTPAGLASQCPACCLLYYSGTFTSVPRTFCSTNMLFPSVPRGHDIRRLVLFRCSHVVRTAHRVPRLGQQHTRLRGDEILVGKVHFRPVLRLLGPNKPRQYLASRRMIG
eukprot:1466594-Rhodomonas_salina.1